MSKQTTQREHTEESLRRIVQTADTNKLSAEARVQADILNTYIILGKHLMALRASDAHAQSAMYLARRKQQQRKEQPEQQITSSVDNAD